MADNEKQMGIGDLKNVLNQQFSQNDKVDKLLEQIVKSKAEMEKETGEQNPFFYGAVSRYIVSSNSRNILDWVDSKGNVNITQINNIAKIAKKEFEIQKQQEQEINREQKSQSQLLETQINEILMQELNKIDFKNLTAQNFDFIAKNAEWFAINSNIEQFNEVVDKSGKFLGADKEFTEVLKLWKRQQKEDYTYTEEDKSIMKTDVAQKYIDKQTGKFDDEKMQASFVIEQRIFSEILNLCKTGNVSREDLENIIKLEFGEQYKEKDFPGIIDRDAILSAKNVEELKQYVSEHSKENEIEEVSSEIFNSDEDLLNDIGEDIFFEESLESSSIEETKDVQVQEEKTELKDYEIEIPDDNKKGLSKIFSKIKGFFQQKFAKKESQKLLGQGQVQRIEEDGLKITTHTGNGNMEPWPIQFRHMAIEAGENFMNLVSKITKFGEVSNTEKPINQPVIIKSAELKNNELSEKTTNDVILGKENEPINNKKVVTFEDILNPNSEVYANSRPNPANEMKKENNVTKDRSKEDDGLEM